jgi:hypothetical protein
MTTIITRLYADQAAARAVVNTLLQKGQDDNTINVITRDTVGGPEAAMKAARIPAASAMAYAHAMKGREALLVVAAPFNPMGAAREAINVVRKSPAIDVGLADEDVYIREDVRTESSGSVLSGQPLIMSNPHSRPSHHHILGSNPIIASKPRTSAIHGGAYMSRFFWPMKLVSASKEKTSAIRGGFLFSSMFGIPTLFRSWGPRDDLPTIL